MFGRKRLARENAILRNALAWYADSSNWKRCAIQAAGEPRRWVKSAAAFDRGGRARLALAHADAPDCVAWSMPVVGHTSRGPSARIDLERIAREGATPPSDPSLLAASESRSTTQESS
jgi:hypothetical protein